MRRTLTIAAMLCLATGAAAQDRDQVVRMFAGVATAPHLCGSTFDRDAYNALVKSVGAPGDPDFTVDVYREYISASERYRDLDAAGQARWCDGVTNAIDRLGIRN